MQINQEIRSPEDRARELLRDMSLTEKLRQLGCTMALPMLPLEQQDLKGGIGAANLMGGEDYCGDLRKVQDYIMDHSPHRIPALFHAEALAGTTVSIGGNQYPISVGLGATFEPEIVEEMCDATRRQMLSYGVRHALSPVCDLARDPRWGRSNECYGNDPTLAAAMTVAFVKGLQGNDLTEGIAACGKHFIGYSQTEAGLNTHKTMVDPREIREQFAKPFEAAINLAGLKTVMNSYSAINGKPVAANKEILTDLLRDQLGFKGIVVSDYTSLPMLIDPAKMAETPKEAGIMALKAGLDIECPTRTCYGDCLGEAIRDGLIDEAYVDQAVLRILTLKYELGLFENPYPREEMVAQAWAKEPNETSSYHAAQKTMTLLKNDGILPITDRKKKLAVIGPSGNCLRMLFSHYTAVSSMEMMANLATEGDTQQGYDLTGLLAGMGDSGDGGDFDNLMDTVNSQEITNKYVLDDVIRQHYPKAKTIFEAISEKFESVVFEEGCEYKGDDDGAMDRAIALAANVDAVILCVGGKNGIGRSATSGEGIDSCTLELPGRQEQLMRKVFAANPNMVIVHTDARPLISPWAYENAPAILEAWLPNTYGGNAIADVICGEYNPSGRTPVDVPRSVGHLPVYHYQQNGSSSVHNKHLIETGYADGVSSVLAPFGYGLSYTEFTYSGAHLESDENDNITISVRVRNIGNMDGEEVVQLYGVDEFASILRPIHELVGFKRVALKAGEEKTVVFTFNIDALSFVGDDGKWIVEKGGFRFILGSHSEDNRAELTYRLQETKQIDPNRRTFYADTRVVQED